ncbi:MAG: HAD hydrolase-like protein, partial [Anaerolineae bacterium]|nr:HAD hydrolase-like protein [Anaerolineae bacterium]
RAIDYCQQSILPRDITVIGDTEADIACARAVGARAIAVATGFADRDMLMAAQPDHLLDDLTGLPGLLM